jgi:hypothetical protein
MIHLEIHMFTWVEFFNIDYKKTVKLLNLCCVMVYFDILFGYCISEKDILF